MFERSYVVMDRLPGKTLHELTYRRPEVLEDNKVTIAYQLGLHTAFSYVFGSKDGYQTNYVFDTLSKVLTRVDKESFLEVPSNPGGTLSEGDPYTQEIAACEMTNLKYIPSFRTGESRTKLIYSFRQGFIDKFGDIKSKKEELLKMVSESRTMWLKMRPVEDHDEYMEETKSIIIAVELLMLQDQVAVFDRLMFAKSEVDSGRYKRGRE